MTTLRVLLVACMAALALVACNVDENGDGTLQVACLGDSNTSPGLLQYPRPPAPWCTRMATLLPSIAAVSAGVFQSVPTAWQNQATGGTTAIAPPASWPYQRHALVQLRDALAAGPVDVVLAAFTTNDAWLAAIPEQVVAAYQALGQAAAPRAIWVGLTPPRYTADWTPALEANRQAINAALRAAFCRVLDLETGFDDAKLYVDGLHFTAEGQQRRAERVAWTLQNVECSRP